ncbi:hypothetical protein PsorP6_006779 [Peronosclerospora sorghi]|uniref:Uncharacterized protein n=1 Tax=Peronosclerospora sorghi TaxID=230839 RepID=A0ACC0W6E6_9STRA|nr:hypothetical protein PsorP6_006779 [Peronosclerospora sorghi]
MHTACKRDQCKITDGRRTTTNISYSWGAGVNKGEEGEHYEKETTLDSSLMIRRRKCPISTRHI